LQIEMMPTTRLVPYAHNARTHSDDQVAQIAASIAEFGFTNPILIGEDSVIIAGHGRLMAARRLGLTEVPVIMLAHLTEVQRRALVIADNRIAESAGWDEELLRAELSALQELSFDLDLVGFSDEDLAGLLGEIETPALTGAIEGEDDVPEPPADPVSRPGDLWILGHHRLLCGDSTVATDVERALAGVTPLLMVTDPPYGVEYDPNWRNQALGQTTARTGKVLNDDRADWREAWALVSGRRGLCLAWRPARDHGRGQTFTPQAIGLRPFSPVHVAQPWRRAREPGDLTIRWIRRDRSLSADNWSAVEIPMTEASEAWQVQILDGATVLRSLTASTTSAVYTAAQQTADWGAPLGPGASLDIRIAQIGQAYGAGAAPITTLWF